MKEITLKINGKQLKAVEGETILKVAKNNNIKIPALCYHPDLNIKANCRLCLVDINGINGLQTACSINVKQGMEINTDSTDIRKARKMNLELIFAQHREECSDCVWNYNCHLLELAKEYEVDIERFNDRKSKSSIEISGPIEFDFTKCMDCRNCVEMCKRQGVGYLEVEEGKDDFFHIRTSSDPNKDCVYCGQCINHCPVGAIESTGEFESIEEPLNEKNKFMVVQFAPAIRASIGEEFGMETGQVTTGKIVAALRKLGFKKVFDTCVAADITTIEEAKELVERIQENKPLPMMTSCCPAWVKFIEFYYPEFIDNLTTVRSPQIILGGLVKTYFAKQESIAPKDVKVVSIMPCTAKKYEVTREELKVNGHFPVDYVLTTRELARLIKKHKIDFVNIENEDADQPLGLESGAAVIYGSTGGVMESALRTAAFNILGENLENIEFESVRGMNDVKRAEVEIKGKKLRIAVVNGLGNAKTILDEIKKDPEIYHYIEVMACPGGCIGGGGQPLPTNIDIRKKRAAALYDSDKNNELRLAHESPAVKGIYKDYFNNQENIHNICHTKYVNRQKK
jgi:iron-only hydrogenase group A